ncbi:MAG: hypothetical protein C5S38_08665 [Candidatus Methanophagaceae archaeon]|jgi:hypothetical protein|nr:MAG: hypothetical protein C5S38_08665 [Methanophagales archaeon]KAF5436434.1 protein of unknown function (DUF4382) [Methanophagales archaeon]
MKTKNKDKTPKFIALAVICLLVGAGIGLVSYHYFLKSPPTTPKPITTTPSLESPSKGYFQLLISDVVPVKFSDFDRIVVNFSHAEIYKTGNDSIAYRTIDLNGTGVDLTQVVGKKARQIATISLCPGKYSEIELYILDVHGVLANGQVANISGPKSKKLQIVKNFWIEPNKTTKFVFDIYVFGRGNTNNYGLIPVPNDSGVIGKDLKEEDVEVITGRSGITYN